MNIPSNDQLMAAALVFVGIMGILWVLKKVVIGYLHHLSKKTKNDIDDLIISILNGFGWPFLFFVALYTALKYLVLEPIVDDVINHMLIIFVVYYAAKIAGILIDYSINKIIKKQKTKDGSLMRVLGTIIKLVVWVIAILTGLQNIGFNVTSLLAGVGVGGIAIAFALQRILEDIFSSFSIYFDKPFQVGDFIVIGDDLGEVKHIGLKTTRIKHLKGHELVVSNRELTSTRIHNYKKMKRRRIVFSFGVEYETPAAKLEKIPSIVQKIIASNKLLTLDRVHFKELAAASLNYEVVYFIDSSEYNDYMNAQQAINIGLIKEFAKLKVGFAYPTQTLYVKK